MAAETINVLPRGAAGYKVIKSRGVEPMKLIQLPQVMAVTSCQTDTESNSSVRRSYLYSNDNKHHKIDRSVR